MHRIGLYGPTFSGKTVLIDRLAFPGSEHHDKEGYAHEKCEYPIETRVGALVFVEYPEGHLPQKEDGCTCYIILTTRNEHRWKEYVEAAQVFLQPGEYLTVSTCMDSAKGRERATRAPGGTLLLSIYNKAECLDLLKWAMVPNDERLKRYAIATKPKKAKRSKKKKPVVDEDGWMQV